MDTSITVEKGKEGSSDSQPCPQPQVIQTLPQIDSERRIEYEHNTCAVGVHCSSAPSHQLTQTASGRGGEGEGFGLGFLGRELDMFCALPGRDQDRVGRCWIWNLTHGATGIMEEWDGWPTILSRDPALLPPACANHWARAILPLGWEHTTCSSRAPAKPDRETSGRDRPNLIIWHVKKIKKDSDDSNPCGHDAATVRSTMCRAKLRSRFCLKCKLLPAPATDATGVRPESPERRAGAGAGGDTQPVIV